MKGIKIRMKEILNNLEMKYKIAILAGMLILIITVFIVAYKYYYSEDESIINEIASNEYILEEKENENMKEENNEKTSSKFGISKSEKTIMVHVIGEVQKPGVVTLEEGARIIDAIELAGGKTEDSDLTKINLAYVIEDGVQIYVPRIGETTNEENIKKEAGEGIIFENFNQDETEKKTIKVNINTASLEKLQTLPGVGLSTAQKILDYKKEHGNFKNIEEIKNVSGIGETKFNSLKDYIIVK